VTHHESKRSMGDLRDQCKLIDHKNRQEDTVELYKEILRLHTSIDEMNGYIKRLFNGETLPFRQWSFIQIDTNTKNVSSTSVKHEIDTQAHSNIQNIICNNPQLINNYML